MGRAGYGLERGGGAQTTQARTGGGGEEMGGGMGQGGQKDRLAKADAAARIRAFASSVGGGEDLLLVRPEPPDEQGLRKALQQCGSVRLRGHDTFDGEEVSPYLRLSKQFR